MSSKILDITEDILIDEAIQRYEYHAYEPTGTASYNYTGGEIPVYTERKAQYFYSAESYILFEGRLLKDDDIAYADDNAVALTNNGLIHLFSYISYCIQDQLIETAYNLL